MGHRSEPRLGTISNFLHKFPRILGPIFGSVLLLVVMAHALPRLLSGAYFKVGFSFAAQFLNDLVAGNWGVLGESFIPLLRLVGYIIWWVVMSLAGVKFLKDSRSAWPWLGMAIVLLVLLVQPWAPPEAQLPPGYTRYTP